MRLKSQINSIINIRFITIALQTNRGNFHSVCEQITPASSCVSRMLLLEQTVSLTLPFHTMVRPPFSSLALSPGHLSRRFESPCLVHWHHPRVQP